MKIVLTHPFCWPFVRRGTERNIDNVGRYMAGRGHDCTLLSTRPSGDTTPVQRPFRQQLSVPGWMGALAHVRLRPEHVFGLTAYSALRQMDADAIHSFHYVDSLAASRLRKQRRWRTVLQLNGIAIPGVSCRRFPPEAWLLRRAIDEADEFLVCSRFIAEIAARHFGRAPKALMPPVELEAWPLGPGPADDRPVILAVGDFEVRRKGIRVLFEAFRRLHREVPEAILRISGRFSSEVADALSSDFPDSTRVAIEVLGLGAPEDLPQLYQQASILALPAMWEPSGGVMFEALASGAPVVAAAHAGLPEFLTPEVSALFDPKTDGEETTNADGLLEALHLGLRMARSEGIRSRCRQHASKYSTTAIGPQLEALYAGN
ncbi:MAG TPA: glycosyltransferase family 4 protein [Paludibaculum sp.]|jgi:glycosyltransferase involved in cell wall biosynthesis